MRRMVEIFKVKEIKHDLYFTIAVSMLIIGLDTIYHMANEIFKYTALLSNISITMAGFLITALAILISFPQNQKINFMEDHPTYPLIFYTFIFTIVLSLLLFGAAVFFLVSGLRHAVAAYLIIFLLIWTVVSIIRCVWLLKRMIDIYFSSKTKNDSYGVNNEA